MVCGTGLMQHREHTSRREVKTDTRVLVLLLLMQTTFCEWLHANDLHSQARKYGSDHHVDHADRSRHMVMRLTFHKLDLVASGRGLYTCCDK